MTEKEVKMVFAKKITDGRIYVGVNQYISPAEFMTTFNDVAEISYDNLITANGYIDEEQTGKGYKSFFDQCKAEGILI